MELEIVLDNIENYMVLVSRKVKGGVSTVFKSITLKDFLDAMENESLSSLNVYFLINKNSDGYDEVVNLNSISIANFDKLFRGAKFDFHNRIFKVHVENKYFK